MISLLWHSSYTEIVYQACLFPKLSTVHFMQMVTDLSLQREGFTETPLPSWACELEEFLFEMQGMEVGKESQWLRTTENKIYSVWEKTEKQCLVG